MSLQTECGKAVHVASCNFLLQLCTESQSSRSILLPPLASPKGTAMPFQAGKRSQMSV